MTFIDSNIPMYLVGRHIHIRLTELAGVLSRSKFDAYVSIKDRQECILSPADYLKS